jgi:NAD-dependent dihydropyrimidine dehydrogenase PreA subunit
MNIAYIISGIVLLLWIAGSTYRHIKGRNKIIRVLEGNCTGCRRCIKRCPHKVLEAIKEECKEERKEAFKVRIAVKNPDRCTACGDCIGVCKFNALELVSKQINCSPPGCV